MTLKTRYPKADGLFGPRTLAAVKAWQQAHGLEPDGVWGPKSRALAQDLATERPPPAPTSPAPPVPVDDALTVSDRIHRITGDIREAVDGLDAAADRLRRSVG